MIPMASFRDNGFTLQVSALTPQHSRNWLDGVSAALAYARAYAYRGLPAPCFARPWRAANVEQLKHSYLLTLMEYEHRSYPYGRRPHSRT